MSADRTRRLGIIGGLAVGATCAFYKRLYTWMSSRSALDMVLSHADVREIIRFATLGDREQLSSYLLSHIMRLKSAGAEVIALPAVTPHMCIGLLQASSPLPIVDCLSAIADEVRVKSPTKIAILGTRYVVETGLFGFLPEGVAAVRPEEAEIDSIHNLYVRLLEHGDSTPDDVEEINRIAAGIIAREKVDLLLLAGTDFVVLPSAELQFPFIDSFEVYVRAVAAAIE